METDKKTQLDQTPKPDFRTFKFQHAYPELEAKYAFEGKRLSQNKNKINFVVTHGNCSDGFMSSTIVRRYLREQGVDLSTVTFYNAYYGNDFSKLPEMMKDKYVVICDFSFPKFLFDKMVEATNGNILILDHHMTAQKSLQDVPSEFLTFDMKHSGAFITWVYFFGFDNVPKTVLYVEDNDIWTKKLPQTREFTAYMFSRKFDYDEYEKFFDDTYLLEQAFPVGSGMVMQNDAYIEQLNKKSIPQLVELNGRYYFVSCLNTPILKSELGNYVLTVHKNANLSMMYSHDPYYGNTAISYRSMDDRSDSTEIAKINGGGGHRNASGAGIPFMVNSPPGRVVDQYRAYFMLDSVYETTISEKHFLALNTATTAKYMVAYLMQERFINDEGKVRNKPRTDAGLPGYQEGLCVMRNRYENPDYDRVYSGAYGWSFDGFTNTNKITLKTLPGVINAEKLANIQLDGSVKVDELKNNVYVITAPASINIEQLISLLM
ncbi:DHH family phosphohydrolase [Yasminevirus sp. GU-2018]|uniref:DHH family phosphohydrolase n=1 Tax=Yasminevirus sp. GU-2018 TaxID=2420051 RepID=A0A5K0U8X8_9VIRU|nr:DHH family phosphohydrolase [Yasminevirus sp. GU-2018]